MVDMIEELVNFNSDGLKLEGSKLDLDAIINCSQTEEIIDAKPDLLIADYSALSKISVDTLVEQKVEILILWSHCLPCIEGKRLSNFILKGVVGIYSPKTNGSGLSMAIEKAIAGELWYDRKQLKIVMFHINNVRSEIGTHKVKIPIPINPAKGLVLNKFMIFPFYKNKLNLWKAYPSNDGFMSFDVIMR